MPKKEDILLDILERILPNNHYLKHYKEIQFLFCIKYQKIHCFIHYLK